MKRGQSQIIIGGTLLGVIILAGLLSLIWTPADPLAMAIDQRMQMPSAGAWLGTDHFGRDILARLMAATPLTLSVAFIGVSIGFIGGVPLGLIAALTPRPLIGQILMRGGDVFFAFPILIMAMLITAGFGGGAWVAILAIGFFNIPVFLRVTRAGALGQSHCTYIQSARLAGKSDMRIAIEHIFPNIAPLLILQASIQFSLGVLAEAGLSYLGLGASPTTPSWGRMLADSQTLMGLAPHLAIAPGVVIVVTVLAINLIAEGLRQRLDPRQQNLLGRGQAWR